MALVSPVGGILVNRVLSGDARTAAVKQADGLPSIVLSARESFDLEMIAIGAFSPLIGFMGREDFTRCCKEMRLASGVVWPIPVTLSVSGETASGIKEGSKVALRDNSNAVLAIMT